VIVRAAQPQRLSASRCRFRLSRIWASATLSWGWLLLLLVAPGSGFSEIQVPVDASGLGYTNLRVAEVPWSIHVIMVARSNSLYEVHSVHAGNTALGLETLSEQISAANATLGVPVAAINGDFYQRDRSYAGAARGLQVVDGELLSGPGNKINMWLDANGEVHASPLISKFEVTWPDGTVTPFRINGERSPNGLELYTPAVGHSTRTSGSGRELVLERADGSPWLPLRVGKSYIARVREVREAGDSRIDADTLVLSLGPGAARRLPAPAVGASLTISTATLPVLHGVKTALGGGPLLVHNGHRQRLEEGPIENYESASMFERHPRAAIGWNQDWWYLVEVDGRQRWLSVGMTLDELASFMLKLGCREAMNCDGGGSATLWYQGEVRNSPCDRGEREIANCLVITKRPRAGQAQGVADH